VAVWRGQDGSGDKRDRLGRLRLRVRLRRRRRRALVVLYSVQDKFTSEDNIVSLNIPFVRDKAIVGLGLMDGVVIPHDRGPLVRSRGFINLVGVPLHSGNNEADGNGIPGSFNEELSVYVANIGEGLEAG
jgi:hypothetical protein